VRFDATLIGIGTFKGSSVLGEADKLRIDADVAFGVKDIKTTVVGTGTKLYVKDSTMPAVESKVSPKGLGVYFRGVLPRVGIFPGLDAGLYGREWPQVDDDCQVSDFKLGAKEKIGTAETRVVEYTVLLKGKKGSAKMWINTKTNLPAKLELRIETGGIALELSETYTEFVIDGKLDAKQFEALK
jgi:hypothetical protein